MSRDIALAMPQRHDQVELCAAKRREEAEHHADQHREADGEQDHREARREVGMDRARRGHARPGASPSTMPISPPSSDSTVASTRNCTRMCRSCAPMARRTPISRVRSVTDTSMMFMMPMPPTSRLTPRHRAQHAGHALAVAMVIASAIWVMSRISNIVARHLGAMRLVSRRIVSMSAWTAEVGDSVDGATEIESDVASRRRCGAGSPLSGSRTTLSWSWPKTDGPWPITPITLQLEPFGRGSSGRSDRPRRRTGCAPSRRRGRH